MNRTIIFQTDLGNSDCYFDYITTKFYIENNIFEKVVTTQLIFLSFDLFEQGFSKIILRHKGKEYDLKLGSNTWTVKNLRKEHNLLKIVTSYILNNE
jgi:hemin uptake protein HemP